MEADPGFLQILQISLRHPCISPLSLPQDHYDVKMPAHSLLVKLAALEPATILAALERLVAPLEKTLLAKVSVDKMEHGLLSEK